MSYTHFTLKERKYLQQLLSEGYSFRKIAAILERSPSTISREVKRNKAKYHPHRKTDNVYWYNHWRAQNLYIRRRREQVRAALQPDTAQWNYIVTNLNRTGRLRKLLIGGTRIILRKNLFVYQRFIDT